LQSTIKKLKNLVINKFIKYKKLHMVIQIEPNSCVYEVTKTNNSSGTKIAGTPSLSPYFLEGVHLEELL